MSELVIKVPAPFAGTPDLGFSTRYPDQELGAALRDVPFIIEGPTGPMRKLRDRLSLFSQKAEFYEQDELGEAYTWTEVVSLSDEILVLAFRDRSLQAFPDSSAEAARNYFLNLIRPLVFPFLKDCVRIGQLRLSERIDLAIESSAHRLAELELRRQQITRENGTLVLWDLALH